MKITKYKTNRMENRKMLSHIKYLRLNFTLLAKEQILLNKYKGSALRGGFGYVFRDIACTTHQNDCTTCLFKNNCSYAYVFRSLIPEGQNMRSATVNMPVPFVLEPPMTDKNLIETGELFNFGLVIMGKSIDYLSYFIYCFEELGHRGLGKNHGMYNILSITCCGNNKIIYQNEKLISENILIESMIEPTGEKINGMQIEFKTPFRAMENHKMISDIHFELLMKNLLRRIDLISYYHCDKKLSVDFKGIVENSKHVLKSKSNLNFYNWERISSKTQKPILMGGYTGMVEYSGDITEMMPFIKLGEIFHIGKGCSFGMGKYTLASV